jgi:archaellum component FlaC
MDNEIMELLKAFKDDINKQFKNINDKLNNIESDINGLKLGQEEIKSLVKDLEPKNANRHVEIISSINDLRKDLSTVEIVTANNYADIAKLKAVK